MFTPVSFRVDHVSVMSIVAGHGTVLGPEKLRMVGAVDGVGVARLVAGVEGLGVGVAGAADAVGVGVGALDRAADGLAVASPNEDVG